MKTYHIKYKDHNNEVTERIISSVKTLDEDHIAAHCHLRGETRHFLKSRILCLTNADTGEILAPSIEFSRKKRKSLAVETGNKKAQFNIDISTPGSGVIDIRNNLSSPFCKKCGHQRNKNDDPNVPDYQCPACGAIYAKYGKPTQIVDGLIRPNTKNSSKKPGMVERLMDFITDGLRDNGPAQAKHQPTQPDILLDSAESMRYKTNHILHILLSLASFGAWLAVWFLVTASNTRERNKIHRRCNMPLESNGPALLLAVFGGLLALAILLTFNH